MPTKDRTEINRLLANGSLVVVVVGGEDDGEIWPYTGHRSINAIKRCLAYSRAANARVKAIVYLPENDGRIGINIETIEAEMFPEVGFTARPKARKEYSYER